MSSSSKIPDVGTREVAISRARDFRFLLTSASTGTALPLSAADKVVFSVKAAVTDTDALFTRTLAAGGIALVTGGVDVLLVEANTALMTAGQGYPFELHYELAADGKDRCACRGVLYAVRTAGNAIP